MAAVDGNGPAVPAASYSLALPDEEACPGEHARGASECAVVVQLAEGIPSLEHLAAGDIRPSKPAVASAVVPAASVHLVEVLRGSGIDTFQFRRWYDSVLAALARF
jgi:hypothetical protein